MNKENTNKEQKATKRSDISDLEVVMAVAFYKEDPDNRDFPYVFLADKFNCDEKLAYSACERACDHDLIDYGVSLRTGWLTEKGLELLKTAKLTQPSHQPHLEVEGVEEDNHVWISRFIEMDGVGINVAKQGDRWKMNISGSSECVVDLTPLFEQHLTTKHANDKRDAVEAERNRIRTALESKWSKDSWGVDYIYRNAIDEVLAPHDTNNNKD